MSMGQNNGSRIMVQLARLRAYVAGKVRRSWAAEDYKSDKELNDLIQQQDQAAAQKLDVRSIHEVSSSYALRRDLRYARRGRKWLKAFGVQQQLNHSYEQWLAFVRQNRKHSPEFYLKTDPNQLKTTPWEQLP